MTTHPDRQDRFQPNPPDHALVNLKNRLFTRMQGSLSDYREFLPALIALLAVAAFWTTGLLGGLAILRHANSWVGMLTGLYLMLALVTCSLITGVLATNNIAHRIRERNTTPTTPR